MSLSHTLMLLSQFPKKEKEKKEEEDKMYNCVWFTIMDYSFIYIYLWYFLFTVNLPWIFFFFVLYIFVLFFFCYIIYLFILNYHIVMVINSKLVIGYEILKSIPTQNQSYCILYTAPNCTCGCKIEMLCSDGFGQTAS